MFYFYLRFFVWMCNIFGIRKPLLFPANKQFKCNIWYKIWSFLIIAAILANYFLTQRAFHFDIKKKLYEISKLNEIVVNVALIFIEFLNKDEICIKLYETINSCFQGFNLKDINLRMLAMKIYFWLFVLTVLFLVAIIFEIILSFPPFVILLKIPTFLTFSHLVIHLYLILSLLKKVNYSLAEMCIFGHNFKIKQKATLKRGVVTYLFNFNQCFYGDDDHQRYGIKFLCLMYDNISSCVKLLEKCHGLQILLTTWLMFSSAVSGFTLVITLQAGHPYLVLANSVLPFLWCFISCFVEDQLRKEVEKTDHLIIKHLIDFRCDQPRKNALQSFKQLVSTHRLQFTSCDLFGLNYSMILGTIVNIITYSIILIQLQMSKD